MFAMSHKEKEFCLRRQIVPRLLCISDIYTDIFQENVISDSTFLDMIRGHAHVRKKWDRNIVWGKKHRLLATREGSEVMNRILPKCLLNNFFTGITSLRYIKYVIGIETYRKIGYLLNDTPNNLKRQKTKTKLLLKYI